MPSVSPAEKPQTAPTLSAHPGRPPSPNMSLNGYEPRLVKNSTALQSERSKACKKKKKRLSDIFGHIVGGSKESSVITKAADQLHTTTCALKEEPEDSPYADLDSVPMLHRAKRTAFSPKRDVDTVARKELASHQSKTRFTEKNNHSRGSGSILTKKFTSENTNSAQSSGSCNELLASSTKKHSMNLPASSRLITRALEAEEDTDINDVLATSQLSTDVHAKDCPDPLTTVSIKSEASLNWETSCDAPFSANHSSPKRRARKSDKKQIRNGSFREPKSVGTNAPTGRPVEIKAENVPSSSPSLSPMEAFQDPKEVMFKSLAKEDSSEPELNVFRPDSNYKFSTFLMLLKDMHDTREKEGKPLTLPPSPVLIKEEPLVIPTSTAGEPAPCDSFTKKVAAKNRTKPIMKADTYHCEDFPIISPIGNADKQRRKQRLPAKLKVGIPGLSADLNDLAYGREFVSGHADLAVPRSGPSNAAGPSVNYLDKSSASSVAPKKRWQLVEEDARNRAEVTSEASTEMTNGSHAIAASPDLEADVEGQTEGGMFFSEKSGKCGKTFGFITWMVRKERDFCTCLFVAFFLRAVLLVVFFLRYCCFDCTFLYMYVSL